MSEDLKEAGLGPVEIEDCAMVRDEIKPELSHSLVKIDEHELILEKDWPAISAAIDPPTGSFVKPVSYDVAEIPAEILEWRADGTHKAQVYAYDQTGFLLTLDNHKHKSNAEVLEWEEAMNEYFSAHPTETT